jgi:hypothetical protein
VGFEKGDAKPIPVGAQMVVTFLSDRTANGMGLETVEGLQWEPVLRASSGRDIALAGFWNRRP